jgi:hypothetical protein
MGTLPNCRVDDGDDVGAKASVRSIAPGVVELLKLALSWVNGNRASVPLVGVVARASLQVSDVVSTVSVSLVPT